MDATAGVFQSREQAEQAVQSLRRAGIAEKQIALLTPAKVTPAKGDSEAKEYVRTSDTEQPGMGTAMGGVVGAAVGVAGGTHLGAAMLSATIPGVGPVIAIGLLGGAIVGLAGAKLGNTVEDNMSKGLPADELFVYEDALRQGRSVVVVLTDEEKTEAARTVLDQAGAESIDAARRQWWIGLRDVEKEHYQASGRNFENEEDAYRMGYEAALTRRNYGRDFTEALVERRDEMERLAGSATMAEREEAFRHGYERGSRRRYSTSKAA